MNKKQLQESIMSGVRKAFARNKAINEGFSQWKEQNVPKIDYTVLNQNIVNVSKAFMDLMKSKQIGMLWVMYHNVENGSWSTVKEFKQEDASSFSLSNLINDAIKRIKESLKDEDKFVSKIGEIYIKIAIPNSSHLMKYITSTIDPGSNRIKNKAYFALVRVDENNIGLRFSLKSLIDFGDEIVEYFT